MSSHERAFSLILLAAALTGGCRLAHSQALTSLSCDQATTTKPQVGAAYNGTVSQDDYKLHARIPGGLTGWSGVASEAPFHGFTIFLDPSMHNCIVFEVHLRIDEDDMPVRPRTAKSFSLGNAKAWQVSNATRNRTKGPINVTTYFTFRQIGQIDDGRILLISRPEEFQKSESIYKTFLKSVSLNATRSP